MTYPGTQYTAHQSVSKVTTVLSELRQGNGGNLLTGTTIHVASLPWIKDVAKNYQRWGMRNVKIWYEPSVGTQTQGTVHLVMLRDFADADPSTPVQFMNFNGAQRRSVGAKMVLPTFNTKSFLYCSRDKFDLYSETDKNDRAAGKVQVLIEGVPTTGDGSVQPTMLIGRVYMEFIPVLTGPIDAELNDAPH